MMKKTTLKLYIISQQIYLKKMSYVPEFVALYEIFPYIEYLPLDDETIRVAVKDYLAGGETMNAIIKKYGKIEDWNTSEVTDMSKLFCMAWKFNQSIGDYVSKVTDMERMFYEADNFNQDISKWDTSKVTSMGCMFYGAESFNLENAPWYHE